MLAPGNENISDMSWLLTAVLACTCIPLCGFPISISNINCLVNHFSPARGVVLRFLHRKMLFFNPGVWHFPCLSQVLHYMDSIKSGATPSSILSHAPSLLHHVFSLFILRKPRSPLILSEQRSFLRVKRL